MMVVLVILLAAGFIIGFFRGVIRQAFALGAVLVIFVVAAYLRAPLGQWLASTSSQFGGDYAQLLAFGAIFVGLSLAALVLIQFSRSPSNLTRYSMLDDALGGLLGLLLVAVAIGLVSVILDSYFIRAASNPTGELSWVRETHRALEGSGVARFIHDWIIRGLGFVLGPLLPADVHVAMA
jgi:uncharacterized membrane protein required for colicin V production